ncbi:MAG: XrtA/PEP-CTERM system amidotransferase [Pseudomonadota bacterium]
MCGITGLVHLDAAAPVDETVLRAMTDVQMHRGPDGSGLWSGPGVGLGHRRLSIIDIGGGHQPMLAGDGRFAITFNGEIYNFRDLRSQLISQGHSFSTDCDTEVLLKSFVEWGPKCVDKITGMFAFAIWDAKDKSLFLARDRVGKKPLHYAVLPNGWLAFASELKGLLANPALPVEIEPRAVEAYLALGYVPDTLCLIERVEKLPPGHVIHWEQGKPLPRPTAYWDMAFDVGEAEHSTEALRHHLQTAVKARLVADVPLGAFLSGGVDSSAVVAEMAALMDKPVTTCSIGFDVADHDETQYARQVADLLGTDHRVERVAQDNLSMLDAMARVFDEPFADNSCLPTYEVCRVARSHVTVALSGDGGDEVFAGYRRYRFHVGEEKLRSRMPYAMRRPVFSALSALYPKLDWAPQVLRAKSTLAGLARSTAQAYFHSVSITGARERALLRPLEQERRLDDYRPEADFEEIMANAEYQDPLSAVQYLDFKTWLVGDILTKVDRTSMANSLEVRVPLLDADFLKWAGSVPSHLRLKGGEGKWLLKKAFEDVLPDSILYRRKMGFASPIDRWMMGQLKSEAQAACRSELLRDLGLIDPEGASTLLNEHLSGRRLHGRILFALIMLHKSLDGIAGHKKAASPSLAA